MTDELAIKHFRVTRIELSTKSYTVDATSPQDALEKCAKGFGAHAGSEEPEFFAAIAQDRAELATPPTRAALIQELQKGWQLLETMRHQMQVRAKQLEAKLS